MSTIAFAIFAVLELAANPERQLSVGEIGEKYGVSSHHLAKVMHVLGRAGLVRSVRGAGGGYQFVGNTRRTTLLDVIQATLGSITIATLLSLIKRQHRQAKPAEEARELFKA